MKIDIGPNAIFVVEEEVPLNDDWETIYVGYLQDWAIHFLKNLDSARLEVWSEGKLVVRVYFSHGSLHGQKRIDVIVFRSCKSGVLLRQKDASFDQLQEAIDYIVELI